MSHQWDNIRHHLTFSGENLRSLSGENVRSHRCVSPVGLIGVSHRCVSSVCLTGQRVRG